MPDHVPPPRSEPTPTGRPANDEGGLRAPPGLSFWRKLWWWFDFLILVKLARLRFIAILAVIGLVIVKWDTLAAYYERWTRTATQEQANASEFEFFCPMHPTFIRDNRKEKCPICFMPLAKRQKGEGHPEALPPGIANRVQLTPYRVVLAGIQTSVVTYQPLFKDITTVGFVEFNEGEMKQVTARVKGRIDTLLVKETGLMVHAGEELAWMYSPDLISTMRDLLNAKESKNADLMRIANERLALWGISKPQIDEILKTGKANTHLKIDSPFEGHVTRKYVKEGQYVDEGSPLYDIVDLKTVWIQAQVYEKDMAFLPFSHHPPKKGEAVKVGLPVTATTDAFPGQTFEGKLAFVLPHVDQDTRSVVVRFELDNRDYKLRPGSWATVKFKVPPRQLDVLAKARAESLAKDSAALGALHALLSPMVPALALSYSQQIQAAESYFALEHGWVLGVPDTAIIDSGALRLVYRQLSPGLYEGVKVELGPRMVGPKDLTYYPVLSGLNDGDTVVTNGSFLVDAETRLNPAAGSIYFGGGGSKTGNTVRPSTPGATESKANDER